MWFKQNEQKSPQQPEAPAPRPQPAAAQPPAPAPPVEAAPVIPPVAPFAPATAVTASRITPGISLKGEISGREDLWIGGSVEGTMRMSSARMVVGASGKVQGDVEAREIVIEGKVDGNLRAAERLEIAATGAVRGDAAAPRVALHEGAVFNGSMEVTRAGESPALPQRGGVTARTSVAPRGSRFQGAQAASAAGAGSAAIPVGTPPGVPDPTPDSRESGAPPAPSVLHRGIAVDSSEPSE
jgi:cytoskeletal protein CcmA (bactofilin family)